MRIWVLAAVVAIAGCTKSEESKPATPAAAEKPPASNNASNTAKTPKDPAAAAAAAMAAAAKNGGQSPAAAAAAMAMAAKGMQAAMGGKGSLGPIVNWKQLMPFVKDELGPFKAVRDGKGRTSKMGAFSVTEVSRRYKAGDATLRLKIVDTSMAAMLRLPLSMAANFNEDSSEGFKKGIKLEGHTAIFEWKKSRKRAKLVALIGGRYLLTMRMRGGEKPEMLKEVAKAIGLSALAAVKPPAQKK